MMRIFELHFRILKRNLGETAYSLNVPMRLGTFQHSAMRHVDGKKCLGTSWNTSLRIGAGSWRYRSSNFTKGHETSIMMV